MAEFGFKIRGIAEAVNNLDMTQKKVNAGTNNILRQGGFVVKRAIEVRTPVLTGEAKGSVRVGGVSTDGGTSGKTIKIGYDSAVAWRMYFLEEGTYSKGNPKGIKPRHIVRQALGDSEHRVNEVMAQALKELLGG